MPAGLAVLLVAAASLGLVHTLLGPDHYVPFIAMRQACGWSRPETFWVVLACGLGHVLSSVVLGLVGVAAGLAVGRLEAFEAVRGNLAGWFLLAFGLVYLAWGLRQAWRNKPHQHAHLHPQCVEDEDHKHEHVHVGTHLHVHEVARPRPQTTPWVLFIIFLFGPCEPLIPLLMYPAAQESGWGLALVTAVFGVTTIGTMLGLVLLSSAALDRLPTRKLERYVHALAGAMIVLCGVGISFLGL